MRDRERGTVKRARELRGQMPSAEVILWSRLRNLSGVAMRFRRQHPIGPYIADFACTKLRLVVEADGGTHSTDAEIAHDKRRDDYMHSRGWHVLRFSNQDVYKNLDDVLESICRFAPPQKSVHADTQKSD